MQTLIKIGVTYTGTDEKHGNYVQWLKGKDPVEIIALSPAHSDLESITSFDGIVLSGGIDMHPKYYQSSITAYPNAPEHFNEKRDEFEAAVFEISRQNNIPLLGVCRGMQLVNCMLGGTLEQDIGLVANAIHRFEKNDKAHGIHIVPGTLLNEISGLERSVVNSAHHQAIKTLGKGLTVNCKADDGIIEGVEFTENENGAFFLGIQWHPERMYKLQLSESPVAKNIRDRFITEIKSSMENC
ncbi:MAG: gamma-glutamyl-gamma-aminobutyrate hydrolase family protein [Ferruginibacter sp.]|nr:gamma-glutamyl-gamma-aminobutyrate hydrolase family protein [Ferruginibacter sp.]